MHTTPPARTTYSKMMLVAIWVFPVLFLPIGVAVYLQDGGVAFLALGILLVLGCGYCLFRLHRAELVVDADGTLRMSSMVKASVDLNSLREVELTAGLPYPDMHKYELAYDPYRAVVAMDASGNRVRFGSRGGSQWSDPAPIVARIAHAVRETGARCTPRCWEDLHEAGGLAVPTYPEALTEPPPSAWDTPIRTSQRQRTAVAVSQWALASLPLAASVAGAFEAVDHNPAMAATALAGGLSVSVPVALYLFVVRRRANGAYTHIRQDGQVEQREHLGGRFRLRLRVVEGSANLSDLRRIEFVPATRIHRKTGLPEWWRLELQDSRGGLVRFELLHEREPAALLMPQLCSFIEASGLTLDETTHRGLSLRLGRRLTNPAGAPLLA